MTKYLICPSCKNNRWVATESFTSYTNCDITLSDGEIEIEMDPSAEHVRESATSVIILYHCANKECEYSVLPVDLQKHFNEQQK